VILPTNFDVTKIQRTRLGSICAGKRNLLRTRKARIFARYLNCTDTHSAGN